MHFSAENEDIIDSKISEMTNMSNICTSSCNDRNVYTGGFVSILIKKLNVCNLLRVVWVNHRNIYK